MLGRRTAFFRPPYFGDAEPTTLDELVPAQIAKERGYLSSVCTSMPRIGSRPA